MRDVTPAEHARFHAEAENEPITKWIGTTAWNPPRVVSNEAEARALLGDVVAHPDYTPASTPPITLSPMTRTAYSRAPEADTFFGLLPGTNGTGPAMRRACVPADYEWVTSDGRHALGLTLVPSERSDEIETNPWSGRP